MISGSSVGEETPLSLWVRAWRRGGGLSRSGMLTDRRTAGLSSFSDFSAAKGVQPAPLESLFARYRPRCHSRIFHLFLRNDSRINKWYFLFLGSLKTHQQSMAEVDKFFLDERRCSPACHHRPGSLGNAEAAVRAQASQHLPKTRSSSWNTSPSSPPFTIPISPTGGCFYLYAKKRGPQAKVLVESGGSPQAVDTFNHFPLNPTLLLPIRCHLNQPTSAT